MWNCSTICGTETRLQDLFHFLGSCSTFLGRCSTNCGTFPQKSGNVPLFVGLLGYCPKVYPQGATFYPTVRHFTPMWNVLPQGTTFHPKVRHFTPRYDILPLRHFAPGTTLCPKVRHFTLMMSPRRYE